MEDLIKFNTAKLAKEKGFNERSTHIYTIGFGSIEADFNVRAVGNYENNEKLLQPITLGAGSRHLALAPTQAILQKWLRDKHRINVDPRTVTNLKVYDYRIVLIDKTYDNSFFDGITSPNGYSTYEEALEEGLLKALELI